MQIEIISACQNANYLSDFLKYLPEGCLLDKVKTGCGGTTLAMENDRDTIIVMPFVNIIKNKKSQHQHKKSNPEYSHLPELLCVYGQQAQGENQPATDNEILRYIKQKTTQKILVTYDSVERLINLMIKEGIDVYNKYFLLIDEWHILFNSYIFRNIAVRNLLKQSQKFKAVTFMTATPITEEYILEELKDIPIKQIKWDNMTEVNIKPIKTNSPEKVVSQLIMDKLEDKIFGNLHFFVNSVDFIKHVIKGTGLKPEQVKIVCSKQPQISKSKSNQAKLGESFVIEEPLSPVKMINFYTSTAFEGCDIYDEEGKTYIVSDKAKKHTMIDISTLSIQICGRIRNSKYNKEVYHIFNETRYKGNVTLEDFIKSCDELMKQTQKYADEINALTESSRKIAINHFKQAISKGVKYAFIDGDKIIVDKNLYKLDIHNFQIVNDDYKCRVNLTNKYMENGFASSGFEINNYPSDRLNKNQKAKVSFKDAFIEYTLLREEDEKQIFKFGNGNERLNVLEKEKPLIKEAYEKLGVERVKELKFHVTNILSELAKHISDPEIIRIKVKELIKLYLFEPYTASELKSELQRCYDILGVKKKATASQLLDMGLFTYKKETRKIGNKNKDVYTFIHCLAE